MKGVTYLWRYTDGVIETVEHTAMLDLEFLRAAVGGDIELVPYWNHYRLADVWVPCRVFCNEHGKAGADLPTNKPATLAWHECLLHYRDPEGKRVFRHGLRDPDNPNRALDFLVGNILIVTGDDAFMRSL